MNTRSINDKFYNSCGPRLPYWRVEGNYAYIIPNTTQLIKKNFVGIKEHRISKDTFYMRDIPHTEIIVYCASQDRLEISHRVTKRPSGTHLPLPTYLKEGINGTTMYDHENNDPTDDADENLRPTTRAKNACNKKLARNNTSGYKGIHPRAGGKVEVWVTFRGHAYSGKTYNNKIVAGLAYNELAKRHHGEWASLNKITTEDILAAYAKEPQSIREDLEKLDKTFETKWSSILPVMEIAQEKPVSKSVSQSHYRHFDCCGFSDDYINYRRNNG